MSTSSTCSRCGAALPASALGQRCPKCLWEFALDPEAAEAGLPPESTIRKVHYFGDYELLEEIARGGMGVVWKARQVSLNRTVAVKMLLAGRFSSPEFIRRFKAEAEAAARLQHPNIVAIHEVGDHEGQHYFSMDYVQGQDLAQLVGDKPLPARRAAGYLKTIAQAVQYAHQRGVLHRDLKPSNVLIDGNDQPRVTDFGLAKRFVAADARLTSSAEPVSEEVSEPVSGSLMEGTPSHSPAHRLTHPPAQNEQSLLTSAATDLTLTGQILGTPGYMPPEQAIGKRSDIGVASDVYSLGAILFYTLTGRPPFQAETVEATLRQVTDTQPVSPRLLNPDLPRDLETICLKCLAKEPRRRFDSAQILADDLQRWLDHEPIRARPVSPAERLWRWCRRKPALATSLAAVFLLLFTVAIGATLFSVHISRAKSDVTKARDATTEKLREAYLAQARANRLSGRPGQRFHTLAAITNAMALHPPAAQRDQLRNQAIAALSMPDLVPIWTLENPEAAWKGGSIDLARSRYALVTSAGRVEIRRVPDNAVLFDLPARDEPAHLPLAFSPDGRFLAICYTSSRVIVWDLDQRQAVLTEMGNKVWIDTVAFSRDSERVAIGGRAVGVWDLVSRQPLCTFSNAFIVEFLAFDPSGRRLAFGSRAKSTLSIGDVESGSLLHSLVHSVRVQTPAWHPLYPLLAVGCSDGLVRFWNPETGEQTALGAAESGECGGAAFNHRGDLLLNATWTRMVMWHPTVSLSLNGAEPEPAILHPNFRGTGNGSQLTFDADDRRVSRTWWTTPQPRLEIDAISGAPEVRVFHSPRDGYDVLRFALNHDGTLAALALSNAVQLLDVETGVELARLPLPDVQAPLFLPGQDGLVATSDQGLFTWTFQQATEQDEIQVSPPRSLASGSDWTRLVIGPRGTHLAAWHDDHSHIYALPDLRQVSRIGKYPGGSCLGPSFSADEKLLATTRWNNSNIGIWEVATSNLLRTIKVTYSRGATHGRAEFTPDGRWLVVNTLQDLRLYEPGQWTLRASIPWNGGGNQLAFLAGGKVVAISTGTTGLGVHLLAIPEFRELAVLETASNAAIAHLGTSGDGLKLFAVRDDGEVNVWNLPLVAGGLEELGLGWDALLPSPRPLKSAALPRFRVVGVEAR